MGQKLTGGVRSKNEKKGSSTLSRTEIHVTFVQRVGVEGVGQPLHAHARQTSLYLHHWDDEMDNRADVQQLVPRLVPNQLFAGSKRERKKEKKYKREKGKGNVMSCSSLGE